MLAIHPKARTTPAVRAEIARSQERSGVLAQRYGVSTETVRKWRKRQRGAGIRGAAALAPAPSRVRRCGRRSGVPAPACD